MNGVRLVGAAEAHALASVHAAAFGPRERWDAASIATLLATRGTWALATRAHRAMAMFRVAADEAELLTIAVHPDERRLGAGRLLLDAGTAMAVGGGARVLFLEVSTRNVAACALYGAAGFAAVGRRRGYYADGADAAVMSRPLHA